MLTQKQAMIYGFYLTDDITAEMGGAVKHVEALERSSLVNMLAGVKNVSYDWPVVLSVFRNESNPDWLKIRALKRCDSELCFKILCRHTLSIDCLTKVCDQFSDYLDKLCFELGWQSNFINLSEDTKLSITREIKYWAEFGEEDDDL